MGWTAPSAPLCQTEVVATQQQEPSVDQILRIGMDTSKQVFQLHGVNGAEEPVLRRKLRRSQLIGQDRAAAGAYHQRNDSAGTGALVVFPARCGVCRDRG